MLRTRASLAKESRDKRGPLAPCPGCGYPSNPFESTNCRVCGVCHDPALFANRQPTAEGLIAEAEEAEAQGKDLASGNFPNLAQDCFKRARLKRTEAAALSGTPEGAAKAMAPRASSFGTPEDAWRTVTGWLLPPRLLRFLRIRT